jgi:hypothetical protein
LVFAAMVLYLGWWLANAIRSRVPFEMGMCLGVGTLWAAAFLPAALKREPPIAHLPAGVSAVGWALLGLGGVLFVAAVFSLHSGGKPASGWENTTELTTKGVHRLVRHPMQLGGVLAACGIAIVQPASLTIPLGAASAACFLLATWAEDRFNVAKFGPPYRAYMERVPALNLLAGLRAWLREQRA